MHKLQIHSSLVAGFNAPFATEKSSWSFFITFDTTTKKKFHAYKKRAEKKSLSLKKNPVAVHKHVIRNPFMA